MATDNFNRGSDEDLAASSDWTQHTNATFSGNANRVESSSGTGATSGHLKGPASSIDTLHYWVGTGQASTDDQESEIVCEYINSFSDGGPAVQITSAGSFYFANCYQAGAGIDHFLNGSYQGTLASSSDSTVSDGQKVTLTIDADGNLEMLLDDGSVATATNTSYTGGDVGFFQYESGSEWDDWRGGDIGAGGGASPHRFLPLLGVG